MANYLICGASRGIGFELVKTLLDSGHQIIAISRSVDSLEQLNHKNLGTLAIDLSEKQGFGKLKRLVEDFFDSSIDTVLYNAAALKSQDFEDSSLSDWKTTYNTNVFGAVQILQTCKPFLKPKAQVWLVSSMGAIQGSQKFAGLSAYSSSKAALITLGECLAEEWKADEISVNSFALGAVNTEMLKEAFPDYTAQTEAKDMAICMKNFMQNSQQMLNGKTIQISSTTP